MRALLVAGSPEPSSPALVAELAAGCDLVVAVDRGAEACRAAGVVPHAFCGDADTVSEETLAWVRSQRGADAPELAVVPADDVRETPEVGKMGESFGIRLFPPAKYDTDLSLAFSCARELASELDEALEVTLTCASAGRMDHALAVFGVLASNADLAPVLVEDAFECRILSPRGKRAWTFAADACSRHFSFVALADASVVSESGMRWNLDHYRVDALRDRGISNVIDEPGATITCHDGIVAAFLIS